MPVQVIPSEHGANAVQHLLVNTPLEVLHRSCPYTKDLPLGILQTSLNDTSALLPASNGFVHSLVQAYSGHHHLQIRPEDVWLAILVQFSFFVVAHAEELRSLFVTHQGQKVLAIDVGHKDRYTVDFKWFASEMGRRIQENVLDPDLREWIMPGFSTSTQHDDVVASIVMMGTMQKYFEYRMTVACGIPTVTLLGEKTDWEKLLKKIDKLDDFGEEPRQFAELLRPVVRRFIRSFEDPKGQDVISFWQRVLDVNEQTSGMTKYTGWVTAFCFWDEDGKRIGWTDDKAEYSQNGDFGDKEHGNHLYHVDLHLSLDGVRYPTINSETIPAGWVKVPLVLNDFRGKTDGELVAGSIGIAYSASGDLTDNGTVQADTIRPESAWWSLEIKEEEKKSGHDEL